MCEKKSWSVSSSANLPLNESFVLFTYFVIAIATSRVAKSTRQRFKNLKTILQDLILEFSNED